MGVFFGVITGALIYKIKHYPETSCEKTRSGSKGTTDSSGFLVVDFCSLCGSDTFLKDEAMNEFIESFSLPQLRQPAPSHPMGQPLFECS